MVAKMPHRKYAYYRDDQIIFLVTHEKASISDRQLEDFSTKITTDLKGGMIKKLPQVFSFPKFIDRGRQGIGSQLSSDHAELSISSFSIINCNMTNSPADPTELMEIVETLNENFRGQMISGLTIQGASPNWLTSVASQSGGTGGGPSRWPPRAYHGNRRTAPYRLDNLMLRLAAHGLDSDGTGVDVAIFDTAPSGHDLVAAPKEWPDHAIISSLLGPNGKLHLYPASYQELLRLGNTSLNDLDLKLTDHGLFIAGIVHSIAPKADIHLIEVINHCGVGDFLSFVQGLQKVWTEIYDPERKLVLNCSWILEFPSDDRHCRHMNQIGDPDADFERAVREFAKHDKATLLMLDYLFKQFAFLGTQAIAAAGNDGGKAHTHPIASRYPAALESVIGVGVRPNPIEENSIPESGVIAALGEDESNEIGVLGVYLGEFPDGTPNVSKWARWFGTSFATPVLTGAVAAALSSSDQIVRTQDAMEKLFSSGIIREGQMNVADSSKTV
jgi:hypothetical protein